MPDLGQYNLLLPSTGRSVTDEGWETVEPEFVNAWRLALTDLQEHQVILGADKYKVTVDWTNTLRRQKRHYEALRYVYRDGKVANVERLLKARFPQRPSQNPIQVEARKAKRPQLLSIAESVVYDTFLIMNIAAPGCCNFYRASLLGDEIEPNVSLSNHLFESSLYVFLKDGWPTITFLSLKIDWYRAIRQGASQISTGPMERALFALLHISKLDQNSPMEVIWLFYAFESLLQTRVGESFSVIVKRLCLLLSADEKQSSFVRKKMRELYDIRSAIVHGGYEVTHPMHDEGLDKRVLDSFEREVQATDYGYAFLLAAIQRTILGGWKYPQFTESLGGEKFALGRKAE
jgi:hypothetical protein